MSALEPLNEDRVAKALMYLSHTDEEHAYLSGEVKRLEEGLKSTKARLFLQFEGNVAAREAAALASPAYSSAVNEWAEAFKRFKTMDNQRQHEIRITEIWQTLSANRRKGAL